VHASSPIDLFQAIWRNWGLIRASSKRDIQSRYKGTFLGLFWSLIQPILMLVIYTFVFSEVFKAKWGGGHESKSEFAVILFAGLLVFNFLSECLVRSPSLVIANSNYVKKVVYPLEILPISALVAALFHALIALLAWLGARWLFIGAPPTTIFFLPIVWLPMCLFALGLMWFFSSVGVYLRDVGQFVSLLVTLLMFASPIFFPISAIPTEYRYWIEANPLTPVIEMTRDVLHWGRLPDLMHVMYLYLSGAVVCWLGFWFFQKTRKGFADVL
jgi:lipopolysaccharide transport system permease protein